MKKLTTVILVLSLVLGGVALAAAADVPQTSKNLDLNTLQKISDQEAKQLRGTAGIPVGAAFQFGSLTSPQTNGDRLQIRLQDPTRSQLRDGSCLSK